MNQLSVKIIKTRSVLFWVYRFQTRFRRTDRRVGYLVICIKCSDGRYIFLVMNINWLISQDGPAELLLTQLFVQWLTEKLDRDGKLRKRLLFQSTKNKKSAAFGFFVCRNFTQYLCQFVLNFNYYFYIENDLNVVE